MLFCCFLLLFGRSGRPRFKKIAWRLGFKRFRHPFLPFSKRKLPILKGPAPKCAVQSSIFGLDSQKAKSRSTGQLCTQICSKIRVNYWTFGTKIFALPPEPALFRGCVVDSLVGRFGCFFATGFYRSPPIACAVSGVRFCVFFCVCFFLNRQPKIAP